MDDAGIYARESSVLDRWVQLGIAQGRVISVAFPDEPEPDASGEHDLLDRIDDYLAGTEMPLTDVTVALTVPTDRRSVLETVRDTPYGTEIGVAKVASMTAGLDADDESDLGLVRTALAENPAPLLVPDHRVRDGPSAAPDVVVRQFRALEGL